MSVNFTESTASLVNPERGFYGGAVDIFKASNPVKVTAAKALRTQGMTLMYVGFYLTDFMKGDISQVYLDMIQNSLDAIREAGIKCVLRFAYQNDEGSNISFSFYLARFMTQFTKKRRFFVHLFD